MFKVMKSVLDSRIFLGFFLLTTIAPIKCYGENIKFPNFEKGLKYSCSTDTSGAQGFGLKSDPFKGVQIFTKGTENENNSQYYIVDEKGCFIVVMGRDLWKSEAISLAPAFFNDPIEDNFPTVIPEYIKSIMSISAEQCQCAKSSCVESERDQACKARVAGRLLGGGGLVVIDTNGFVPFSRIAILVHNGEIIGYGVLGFPDAETTNYGYDVNLMNKANGG